MVGSRKQLKDTVRPRPRGSSGDDMDSAIRSEVFSAMTRILDIEDEAHPPGRGRERNDQWPQ